MLVVIQGFSYNFDLQILSAYERLIEMETPLPDDLADLEDVDHDGDDEDEIECMIEFDEEPFND